MHLNYFLWADLPVPVKRSCKILVELHYMYNVTDLSSYLLETNVMSLYKSVGEYYGFVTNMFFLAHPLVQFQIVFHFSWL